MTKETFTATKESPLVIIVGGPAGTGKSTVGQNLADIAHAPFIEGDTLHPPENVTKMANGIPLTDDDRWDWLADVAVKASEAAASNTNSFISVAACSALTPTYREFLKSKLLPNTRLVIAFMWAPEDVLVARVGARKNHYMGVNMVASQAALMQVPDNDELIENGGVSIPMSTVDQDPSYITDEVVKKINIYLK